MKDKGKDWKEVADDARHSVLSWFWDLYDAGEISKSRLIQIIHQAA